MLYAEDHKLLGESFRDTFEAYHPGSSIQICSNGLEAIELVKAEYFDFVLLDIRMSLLNGLQTLQLIRNLKLQNQPKIMMVTGIEDSNLIKKAMELGADGYSSKGPGVREQYAVMERVFNGEIYVDPIYKIPPPNGGFTALPMITTVKGLLTTQHIRIIRAICQDHSNEQIARDLGITIKTVYRHRDNFKQVLSPNDMEDLLVFAIVNDFVSFDEVKIWKKDKPIKVW